MHPTIFELNAFGTSRLPPAPSRALLRHLRSGCARCRAVLAPRLIPWMDRHPAAEAAATAADRCDPALAAAYLRAAGRAARAASRPRSLPAQEGRTRQALAILDAAGPGAISRLPRQLLGLPAIEALLHQAYMLGPGDPRLRLRLAGLASDLAESMRGDEPRLRQARCRAMIELGNAHRVTLDLRAAQQHFERAEEEIARGEIDPRMTARLLVYEAALFADQTRPRPARTALAAAVSIYRRAAEPVELARALIQDACVLTELLHDHVPAQDSLRQVLLLIEPSEAPLVAAAALMDLCYVEMRMGNWRAALATLRRHRQSILTHPRGRNRARIARLEGELLGHAGDGTGAGSAFAFSRRELEAIGQLYEAGVVRLVQATALRRLGDLEASQALVAEATESLLGLDSLPEVQTALMVLRTANRFSATRADLPLEAMVEFLCDAEVQPLASPAALPAVLPGLRGARFRLHAPRSSGRTPAVPAGPRAARPPACPHGPHGRLRPCRAGAAGRGGRGSAGRDASAAPRAVRE